MKRLSSKLGRNKEATEGSSVSVSQNGASHSGGHKGRAPGAGQQQQQPPRSSSLQQESRALGTVQTRAARPSQGTNRMDVSAQHPDHKGRGSTPSTAANDYFALDRILSEDDAQGHNRMSRPDRPRQRPPSLISIDAIAAQLEEAKCSPQIQGTGFFGDESSSPTKSSYTGHADGMTPAKAVLREYYSNGPTRGQSPSSSDDTHKTSSNVNQTKPSGQNGHPLSSMPSSSSFYATAPPTTSSSSGYNPMAAFFGTGGRPSAPSSSSSDATPLRPSVSFPSSDSTRAPVPATSSGLRHVASAPDGPPTSPQGPTSVYNTVQPRRASVSRAQPVPQAIAAEVVSDQQQRASAMAATQTHSRDYAPSRAPVKVTSPQHTPLSKEHTLPTPPPPRPTALHVPSPAASPSTTSSHQAAPVTNGDSPTKPKRRQYTTSGNIRSTPGVQDSRSKPLPSPIASPSRPSQGSLRASHTPAPQREHQSRPVSQTQVEVNMNDQRRASYQKPDYAAQPVHARTSASSGSSQRTATTKPYPAGTLPPDRPTSAQTPVASDQGSLAHSRALPAVPQSKGSQKPSLSKARYASGSSEWSNSTRPPVSPLDSDDGRPSPSFSWTSEEMHREEARLRAAAKGKSVDRRSTGAGRQQSAPFVAAFKTVLVGMLLHLEWQDVQSLKNVSRATRRAVDSPDLTQAILQRFLGVYGYDCTAPNEVALTLADLDGFSCSLSFERSDYATLARQHLEQPLPKVTLRMLKSTVRSYSRLAIRLRSQTAYSDAPYSAPLARQIYKPGRALLARVWVPAEGAKVKDSWMSTDELVECERELQRAGIFHLLQRGDVVENICFEDFGNDGKLIFDGKWLRDLSCTFDPIGHLPEWINPLSFAPSHWHGVIASSTGDPIAYFDLTPFTIQVSNSMALHQDKVNVTSPQANYRVTRYVYRATIKLKAGAILGSAAGQGNGPAGLDCVHREYEGKLVIETEGTTEHAAAVNRICTPPKKYSNKKQNREQSTMHAFKVLRQRSRPGALCITPLFAA